ncbi:hypothetical protein [Ruegeria arenilitoris]|uniref:hypothetical protein n=1 Tax=Ruegeria arenilitoris TaxID=1173585 RepID=UPI00147F9E29|nr:hypothetical protein [Ruegeria arenilitoris]
MLNFLKISVSALALSAFVTVPVATVLTADYAYAKNGNGNSGGKGGNGGNNNGGKGDNAGKSGANKGWGSDKKLNGKNTKSASRGGKPKKEGRIGRAVKEDFQTLGRNLQKNGIKGLFKGSKSQVTATRTKSTSVKQSVKPPSRKASLVDDFTLHPSNLGKLNGAINSSINAKLAHIANDQYAKGKGPVSLAAALAVADANFNHLMGEENSLSAEDVKDIAAAFDLLDAPPMTLEEAEDILADPELTESAEWATAQSVKEAYDLTTDDEGNTIDRPTEEQLAAAEAVHETEANLLDHYKGDFSDDDLVAAEQQDHVLDAVRTSNPDDEAVKAALDNSAEDQEYSVDDEADDDDSEVSDSSDDEVPNLDEEIKKELASSD